MSDRQDGPGRRQFLAVVAVAVLLVLAGCAGFGGDDGGDGGGETPTPEAQSRPAVPGNVTAAVDAETAEAFRALVTEDGELTAQGERFLDALAAADLETEQRGAVIESVAEDGSIESEDVAALERLAASPDPFGAEALRSGLDDADGDGILDGETAALGLDPDDPDERVLDVVRQYGDGGYGERELAAIRRLAEMGEFEWRQAEQLGLLDAVADGDVTEDDLAALSDSSGDGLLDGLAAELDVAADRSRPELATVATALGDEAFSPRGLRYLDRYAAVLADDATARQAAYLGLATDVVESGTVSRTDTDALADSDGDGLIDAMERELGLDPEAADPDVAEVVGLLAEGGYGTAERRYIERVIELREYRGHDYEFWVQAEQLGLLGEKLEDGSVTDDHRWQLENNDSDRLLNGMEVEFGTDPDVADTSGDGYEDHLLWGPMRDLGLAVSPDSPNVFVEVDAAAGVDPPSDEQMRAIQDTFESEPPEDIGPINVRFRVCHTEQTDVVNFEDMVEYPTRTPVDEIEPEDIPDPTVGYRNVTGLGFQYLLLADGLVAGAVQGFAPSQQLMDLGEIRSFAVVDGKIGRNVGQRQQAGTIAHELGHVLGIGGTDYAGVDSREVAAETYPSVMNYNHPIGNITFSTGEPFDDYGHMANATFGSEHQDTSRLETMWEAGSADEDALC